MLTNRIAFISLLTIGFILGCAHKDCGCFFPASPLAGSWTLQTITYGLTQKTVTAAEAGYAEILLFDGIVEGGTFQQTRNGLPIQTSRYTLSFPKGGSTEGFIYFQSDSTQQSFRLADSKLFLSQRGPRGVTINDGSTYQYSR